MDEDGKNCRRFAMAALPARHPLAEDNEMRMTVRIIILGMVLASASCTTVQHQTVWRVDQTEIALYHSSTADPASGNIAHVEYCGAKLSRGSDVLHIVYRPIDFPNRDPGFAEGNTVTVTGIDKVKDFGAVEGPDYWISDVKITKSANNSIDGTSQ